LFLSTADDDFGGGESYEPRPFLDRSTPVLVLRQGLSKVSWMECFFEGAVELEAEAKKAGNKAPPNATAVPGLRG
jgi:hypothetical protein